MDGIVPSLPENSAQYRTDILTNSRVILAIRPRSRVCDSLANSLEDPGQPLLYDHSSTKARRILVRGLDGRTLQPTLQVRCLGEERNLRLSEQEISSL